MPLRNPGSVGIIKLSEIEFDVPEKIRDAILGLQDSERKIVVTNAEGQNEKILVIYRNESGNIEYKYEEVN